MLEDEIRHLFEALAGEQPEKPRIDTNKHESTASTAAMAMVKSVIFP